MDGALFLFDPVTHQYVWTNGQFQRILGYTYHTLNKLFKKNWKQLYHPDDTDVIQKKLHALSKSENKPFSGFFRMKHKEKHWKWLYCRALNVQINHGRNSKLIFGIAFDVSDQMHTQHQFHELFKKYKRDDNKIEIDTLTPRERQVIALLSKGYSCREIAKRLVLSFHTISTHRKNIARKLNISNKASLVQFAIENGLN